MTAKSITRRQFLSQVGTLAIGFSLAPVLGTGARAASADGALKVDAWLTIDRTNTVTIFSGKVELGTGVQTALTQIVLEELRMNFGQVRYVQGDTMQTIMDQSVTAGSNTIQDAGPSLRFAAATAFQVVLELASRHFRTPVTSLYAKDGMIGIGANQQGGISYGQLIGDQQIVREALPDVVVRDPASYDVVGKSVKRVELPDKFLAKFTYVSDLVVPDMLHGRVIRPAGRNGTFNSIDPTSLQTVQALPGFIQVVQQQNFVGVIATTEWTAIEAARLLKVNWNPGPALPDQATLPDTLQDSAGIYASSTEDNQGDAVTALQGAATQLEATYFTPYQMHAAMGTSCAVADFRSEPDTKGVQVTVWSSTQGVFPLRGAIAQLVGLPVAAVRVIYMEASGCYGHNGADDAGADAVMLSRAVGKPVRVQWTRQQEHGWEPLAPAMVHRMRGGLDAKGEVAAWWHIVFTPTHGSRPGNRAGHLLAGQAIGFLPNALPGAPRNSGTRNGPVSYAFTNKLLTANHVKIFSLNPNGTRTPATPLTWTQMRPSSLRSLGGFSNSFANESFMDELANAAGADPLEFRLRYLRDPRAVAVMKAMAEKAGWPDGKAAGQKGMPRGHGIAFQQYEMDGAYVGAYVEVQVNLDSGVVRVTRVVVAHDCGLIVNPDGLRNQIEGNVIQGISRTLKEEVKFNSGGVTSVVWASNMFNPGPQYSVINFNEVPSIEIVLIDRPAEPALGAGEPTIGTIPGAIANAIYDATGVRMRTLPFTPARVLASLGRA